MPAAKRLGPGHTVSTSASPAMGPFGPALRRTLAAVAGLAAALVLTTPALAGPDDEVDEFANPNVVHVVTTVVDGKRVRAIVFMQEIFPALAIEAIEPGGEGAPATLAFRNIIGEFKGAMPQGPDGISDLRWKEDGLSFAVTLPKGRFFCQVAATPDAKPSCTPAK